MAAKTNNGRRAAVAKTRHEASTHAGLWLDKYLEELRLPGGDKSDTVGPALRSLLEAAAGTPVPEGYTSAFGHRRAALAALDGGVAGGTTRLFTAEVRGRLVIGLGAQSVRETNVALLHTWGVPFLPGSALKGLASAAASGLSGEAGWKKLPAQGEDHALLFGDTKRAGCVVFHDAWWIPEPGELTLPLDLDVTTVHHPDYYRAAASAPADWDDPNPVAFLTARGKYLVALSGPEAWALRAGEWLSLGLEQLGLGAKTQAGYGRMSLSTERTAREIEAAALREKHKAKLAVLAGLPAQHKGAGTARQHLQWLREALAEGAPAEEVYAIARTLRDRDRKFWQKWKAEERRTEDEKRFMQESGMSDPDPARKS
jgi:CRISPR-associated protein Cmr6